MVKMPEDRVVTQPARGFCRNPQCRENDNQEFTFQVEHDHFSCPKCGANKAPMVGVQVLTHLLIRNEHGPIIGVGGLRYAIGCDTRRAYLATLTNLEAATDNIEVANCPGCLDRAKSLGLNQASWEYQPIGV
jgi:hypothetical protein